MRSKKPAPFDTAWTTQMTPQFSAAVSSRARATTLRSSSSVPAASSRSIPVGAALYQQLLGPAWSQLSPPVQRLHGARETARGTFRVQRGHTWMARLLGAIMRVPAAAERVEVTLRVARSPGREHWRRVFGAHPLDSRQWERDGCLVEALGPVQCVFRLHAVAGALTFEQVGAALGVGRLRLPLPRWLAPRVRGQASWNDGAVCVEVTIAAPGLGLIVGYDGRLQPEEAEAPC